MHYEYKDKIDISNMSTCFHDCTSCVPFYCKPADFDRNRTRQSCSRSGTSKSAAMDFHCRRYLYYYRHFYAYNYSVSFQ